MTLLHFVNLSALTLVPQFLVYKVLLNEYGLDWSLFVLTAGLYLGAALLKLLLEDALLGSAAENVTAAVLRALLGVLDVGALVLAASRRRGLYAPALTAGLAWAFTDAVTRRIIVFWVKAAGPEYSAEHLDSALLAQLALALSLCLALLAALFLRKPDLRRVFAPWLLLGASVLPLVEWLASWSGVLGTAGVGVPALPLLVGTALTLLVVHRTRALYTATADEKKRG